MIQVFIMLSLRFQIKKLSKKAKKRYHFCFGELEELYEKVHVLHIKSCIFYIVPINSLSLSEYSPEKFGKLKCFYITDNILYSFLYPHNYLNLLNLCKEQGGNSAAFLFSTFDQKFILKTITKSERKIFVSTLLPAYLERLETTPKSKIVKIFGVFKISPLNQNVIVMENLIFCKEKCRIFDLKGSKVSRLVKGIENPEDPPCGVVLKDENFLLYGKKLKLNEEARKDIVETLINDFKMLKDCGITDYSLIVSIYSQSFELEEAEERNILKAEDGTLFSLGIIDILQEYNFSKASEKNLKAIVYNELDISVATPIDYFKRISEFLSNIFE